MIARSSCYFRSYLFRTDLPIWLSAFWISIFNTTSPVVRKNAWLL